MKENWEIHWKDYYEILQVHPLAELEVIEAAYKKLAFKYHSDRNKEIDSDQRMKDINESFDILGRIEKRRRYDEIYKQESDIPHLHPKYTKEQQTNISHKKKGSGNKIKQTAPLDRPISFAGKGKIKTESFEINSIPWKLCYETNWKGQLTVEIRTNRTKVTIINREVIPGMLYETLQWNFLGSQYRFFIIEAPADGEWTLWINKE